MKTTQTTLIRDSAHHGKVNQESHAFFSGQLNGSDLFFSPVIVQPKLKIGSPDDQFERQADRVAEAVVSSPASVIQQESMEEEEETLQLKCSECKEELQMKSDSGLGANTAPPGISQKIQNAGGGTQLPDSVNSEMSQKMGADFSNVNIHTGPEASRLNQSLGARAFTHGTDVFFNTGEYNPASREGKRLLAHELTHVVQQESNSIRRIQMQFDECLWLLNMPSLISLISGTAVHAAIAAEFAIQVPGAYNVAIPGGSASPLRSQGICGRDSTTINPQIVGGRAGLGFPDLAKKTGGILEIAEVKPAAYECLIDGEEQLARYILNANADDIEAQTWRNGNGISSVIPMSPSTFTPTDISTGNVTINFAWCSPGLLVYNVRANTPNPVPHQVEVRETDEQTISNWQRITAFVEDLIESGADVEESIRAFLLQNRDLINFVIAAGVGLIVATIAEDIITAGIGIIDDFIIIPIAASMIRIAYVLR